MNLIIAKDYEEMSQLLTNIVIAEMVSDKRVNLSLTGGATPKRFYEIFGPQITNKDYFKHVHYYLFDEIPLHNEEIGYSLKALTKEFFGPCEIKPSNIHPLNPSNYQTMDEKIRQDGGLDMIVMGIGEDGHFCANMPFTTHFENECYCFNIAKSEEELENISKALGIKPLGLCYTYGPRTVLSAKKVVLIANGLKKAEIIKKAIEGPVTNEVPSSILKLHPNLTVILDQDAASLLKIK